MKINDLSIKTETAYFEEDFIILVESHLTKLRHSPNVRERDIEPLQSYKYTGDFYGLLDSLSIDKKYHFIVLRFNGYESSADFKGEEELILVPDFNEIELLKNIYVTRS